MNEQSNNDTALNAMHAQVTELSAQLKTASAATHRQWIVTAWVFVIICAVIAIYLGVVYSRLKPDLQPEVLVEIGVGIGVHGQHGAPPLRHQPLDGEG